jgi:DNA-binding NarL/FixJ family response regulator
LQLKTAQQRRITAVILDQYSLWLETVKRLTERAGIAVVGATTSSERAMETLRAKRPNLFILGLERGSLRPDVLEDLLTTAVGIPELTTLVVADDDDPDFVDQCLDAGAYAYVLKTVHPEDLSAAIRQAVARTVFLFARPSRNGSDGAGSGNESLPALTSRELQVLRLVAEGLPNAQVARRLWISEPTVKYHLSRTYEKLGVSNRTGAARWAERHGLLDRAAS